MVDNMTYRCALIQMCSGVDVDVNLATVATRIAQASASGARMVALPENFVLMPRQSRALLDCARERSGEIDAFLAQQARQHGIVLIGGSFPAPTDDATRVHGSCRVYDEHGTRLAAYQKMHLFDVAVTETESYRESDYTAHGEHVASVDTTLGKIGLSICYDMRFPELYRRLVGEGARILSVPSAFTVPTGRAHWEVLLRARAIENQCFVIAPAQAGEHENGRKTFGHSMVISPWGEVLACLPDGEGVCGADIDLSLIDDIRTRLPALSHRRL
jgi:deaminated glutathione amidase